VFDDNWRVVALHRGAKRARDVKYLGRDVAYVNLGSQMSAILEDLKGKNPAAFALLRAGRQTRVSRASLKRAYPKDSYAAIAAICNRSLSVCLPFQSGRVHDCRRAGRVQSHGV